MRCLCLLTILSLGSVALSAQTAQPPASHATERPAMHATGTFAVKVTPAEPSAIAQAADTGRMTIDKTWSGALTGTSKGEMLTGITKETGSMSYVAMERVAATLDGRSGTFLFQHTGTMQSGQDPSSAVTQIAVVPNSGTAGLVGLSGSLAITQTAGVHQYDFTYTLPSRP